MREARKESDMKKINGIENALLLDLEEARELSAAFVRLVVWEGYVYSAQWMTEDVLRPVVGWGLWRVGMMDGLGLLVTDEVKQEMDAELARRRAVLSGQEVKLGVGHDDGGCRGGEGDDAGVLCAGCDADDVCRVDGADAVGGVCDGD